MEKSGKSYESNDLFGPHVSHVKTTLIFSYSVKHMIQELKSLTALFLVGLSLSSSFFFLIEQIYNLLHFHHGKTGLIRKRKTKTISKKSILSWF